MKKYKAIVKTTQEWVKEIKIPDNIKKKQDIEDYVDNNFQETHYKNFDDSWENNLILKEDYEVYEVQEVKED